MVCLRNGKCWPVFRGSMAIVHNDLPRWRLLEIFLESGAAWPGIPIFVPCAMLITVYTILGDGHRSFHRDPYMSIVYKASLLLNADNAAYTMHGTKKTLSCQILRTIDVAFLTGFTSVTHNEHPPSDLLRESLGIAWASLRIPRMKTLNARRGCKKVMWCVVYCSPEIGRDTQHIVRLYPVVWRMHRCV